MFNYPHKTNTIVFVIISAIKCAKFQRSSADVTKSAYSAMFIFQLALTASSVGQLENK